MALAGWRSSPRGRGGPHGDQPVRPRGRWARGADVGSRRLPGRGHHGSMRVALAHRRRGAGRRDRGGSGLRRLLSLAVPEHGVAGRCPRRRPPGSGARPCGRRHGSSAACRLVGAVRGTSGAGSHGGRGARPAAVPRAAGGVLGGAADRRGPGGPRAGAVCPAHGVLGGHPGGVDSCCLRPRRNVPAGSTRHGDHRPSGDLAPARRAGAGGRRAAAQPGWMGATRGHGRLGVRRHRDRCRPRGGDRGGVRHDRLRRQPAGGRRAVERRSAIAGGERGLVGAATVQRQPKARSRSAQVQGHAPQHGMPGRSGRPSVVRRRISPWEERS